MSNKEQAEREERRRKRKEVRARRRAQAQRDAAHAGRRMLRLADVEVRVGKRHAAIYAAIAKGTFPKPAPLGPKTVGWLEAEIEDWLEARITERDEGTFVRALPLAGANPEKKLIAPRKIAAAKRGDGEAHR